MVERTTVRLPQDLLRRAKRKAADEGLSLTALIEEGVRRVVADAPPKSKSIRKPVPVSRATGGLLPGVDIGKISKIQALDDLEYAERMQALK